jgi:anti-sigma28 factor (negative regulator of flagellin synthesis)
MGDSGTPPADGRPPEMTDRTMRIETLKDRIERQQYNVDERAVADAIVAKLLGSQKKCS